MHELGVYVMLNDLASNEYFHVKRIRQWSYDVSKTAERTSLFFHSMRSHILYVISIPHHMSAL